MNIKTVIFILTALIMMGFDLLSQPNFQDNWNQFRGNQRNGSVDEFEISNVNPQLLWKHGLGSGFSEVLVKHDKLFTMTSEKIDSVSGWEYAVSLDARTGKEVWKTKIDSIFIDVDSFGDGPRSTPTYDNENLYCLSSFGKLVALSLNSGEILWSIDFVKEFQSILPRWAFCTSPLLVDDVLIIEVGGSDQQAFAAFDTKTGKIIWIKGLGEPSYSSPAIVTIDDTKQLIFANDSMLISLDIEGQELWKYRMPLRKPFSMPLFIAPDKIFESSVSNTGGFVVQIKGNKVTEVFKNPSMKNHFSTSLSYNNYIYGFSNATLRCISAENGEIKWSKRGLGKGTLIRVGDKLLVLSDKGVLKIVEAISDAYSEKSSTQAIVGKSWTAPSFAGGLIYLRNLDEIACYKLQ